MNVVVLLEVCGDVDMVFMVVIYVEDYGFIFFDVFYFVEFDGDIIVLSDEMYELFVLWFDLKIVEDE